MCLSSAMFQAIYESGFYLSLNIYERKASCMSPTSHTSRHDCPNPTFPHAHQCPVLRCTRNSHTSQHTPPLWAHTSPLELFWPFCQDNQSTPWPHHDTASLANRIYSQASSRKAPIGSWGTRLGSPKKVLWKSWSCSWSNGGTCRALVAIGASCQCSSRLGSCPRRWKANWAGSDENARLVTAPRVGVSEKI